ncbi:MAG: leucine-rich repeat domain-containing protein [Halanaerobiales bacterium]
MKRILLLALTLILLLFLVGCSNDSQQAISDEFYSVSGKILDPDDNPVEGVELLFSNGFGSATTDVDGKWSKTALKGEVEITPTKENYEFNPKVKVVTGEEHNIIITVTSYYVLPETTKELTEEELQSIISITNDEIIFSQNNMATQSFSNSNVIKLKIGDIILARISDNTPNGLLRIIEDIQYESDKVLVITRPATLEEAFTELRIKEKRSVGASESGKVEFEKELGDFNIHNSIEINGDVNFTSIVEGDIKIKNFRLEKFYFKTDFDFNQDIKLIANSSINYNWDDNPLLSRTPPLAFGPVVVTPELRLYASVEFNAEGKAKAEVSFNQNFGLGVNYENRRWNNVYEPLEFTPTYNIDADVTAGLYGSLGPQLRLMLYEFIGPYCNLLSYAELESNVDLLNLKNSWSLELGVKGNLGVIGSVLGKEIVNYQTGDLVLWSDIFTQQEVSAFEFDDSTGTITGYYVDIGGKDVIIPSKINGVKVTSIGKWAFNDNELTSVVIPDSVTSIGYQAFFRNNLTLVEIGNSVTSIGTSAFHNNNLTSVVIPDSVASIGSFAFQNNNLTSVEIGNSVTSIGPGAFFNNELTSVVIPDGVTSIEKNTFQNNNLTSVEIPDSVTSIGHESFRNNNLTSVVIGNSVTTIGQRSFRNNNLTSVVIPNSVTSIFMAAFDDDVELIGWDN